MTWNPGDGDDVNEGGDGNDTVVVNGGTGDEDFRSKPSATAGRVQFDRVDPAPFNIDIGTSESLVVNGGGGDDEIKGSNGLAGLIASTFNGDDGKDDIKGTDGPDSLSGGAGGDLIRSIDRAADSVECGSGFDLALVDRRDTVRGCNIVLGGALKVKVDRQVGQRRGRRRGGHPALRGHEEVQRPRLAAAQGQDPRHREVRDGQEEVEDRASQAQQAWPAPAGEGPEQGHEGAAADRRQGRSSATAGGPTRASG